MGRLIDADAITVSNELAKKIVSYNLTPYIKVDDLLEFIDNLPTAYDVEKVVAELENAYPINPYPNDFSNGRDMAIKKAIDIVRKGGVE